MTTEEAVYFKSGELALEGVIRKTEGWEFAGLAVVCHPHPQYGGAMDNPLVRRCAKEASERGFATLRFNFRGVGRSEGSYDGGEGEVDDLLSAVDYLCEREGGGGDNRGEVHLIGYSFGGWIALKGGERSSRVRSVVSIAPPLAMIEMAGCGSFTKPKLFIRGGRDDYCPVGLFRPWFEELQAPKVEKELAAADHFFSGFEEDVALQTVDFIADGLGHRGRK